MTKILLVDTSEIIDVNLDFDPKQYPKFIHYPNCEFGFEFSINNDEFDDIMDDMKMNNIMTFHNGEGINKMTNLTQIDHMSEQEISDFLDLNLIDRLRLAVDFLDSEGISKVSPRSRTTNAVAIIAKELGVSNPTLWRWLNGITKPPKEGTPQNQGLKNALNKFLNEVKK